MYIGATKPYTALVAEHTFLLCKPDAEHHHRHILQILSDAGFQVLAKSFIITPALAEEIANTFPSVRRRMYAERGLDKLFSGGKSVMPSDPLLSGKRGDRASVSYFNGGWDMGESGTTDGDASDDNARGKNRSYSGKVLDCHCEQVETHQSIMAEIIRLTGRHKTVEDGVNAGLPNADRKDPATDVHNTPGVEGLRDDAEMQSDQKTERRVAAAAVLKNTMLEAMSYQDLLEEHVRHLAIGGTCVAVELSRQNAVERLLEIVGPENPITARRVAPNSIRARFGKDLIHNAVHAASNLAEASHCISAVFGFTTHYSTADIRTNTTMSVVDGIKHGGPASGSSAVVRPHCELICVPRNGSPALAASFHVEKTNPQAHISYYTGQLPAGEAAKNRDAVATQGDAMDASSWQERVGQLEKKLAREQAELATHAKILRARELDLLLREHAMERATRGLCAPAKPVERKRRQGTPPGMSSLLMDDHMAMRRGLFVRTSEGQSFAFQNFQKEVSTQQSLPDLLSSATRCSTTGTVIHNPGGMAPMIHPEDISQFFLRPVRLRALYVALKKFSQNGEVMREDVVALYDRSPAVQLLWIENHRNFFCSYLEQHTEEPVLFDSFVLVLMFLLKQ